MSSPVSPLQNVFPGAGLVTGMRTVQMVQMRRQVTAGQGLAAPASSVVEVRWGSVSLSPGCAMSMKTVGMDQKETARKRRNVHLEGLPVGMGCAHRSLGNVMDRMIAEMEVMRRAVYK